MLEGIIMGQDKIPLIGEFIDQIKGLIQESGLGFSSCDFSKTREYIKNNKHNAITVTYYLLIKKK